MKRFLAAIGLTFVLSASALAGDIPMSGVASPPPGEIPMSGVASPPPGEIPMSGVASPPPPATTETAIADEVIVNVLEILWALAI